MSSQEQGVDDDNLLHAVLLHSLCSNLGVTCNPKPRLQKPPQAPANYSFLRLLEFFRGTQIIRGLDFLRHRSLVM